MMPPPTTTTLARAGSTADDIKSPPGTPKLVLTIYQHHSRLINAFASLGGLSTLGWLPSSHPNPTRLMKTARKAVRLLRAFTRQEPELGVNELARRLDLDPATVHRLLRTMQAERFVEQDETTRKYRLGLGVLELASGLLQQRWIVGMAMPYLEELHSKTEETVILDVFNGAEVVCLAALNSPQEV